MRIEDDFNNLTNSVKEYANLRMDAIKLLLVENLSLFLSSLLSAFMIFFFFGASLFFALLATMIMIARCIGFFYASLVICVALAIIAFIIYLFRKRLFANFFVARFSKAFFDDSVNNE